MATAIWFSRAECIAGPYARRGGPASAKPPKPALGPAVGNLTQRGSDDAVLVGVGRGRSTRGNAELREDVAHMPVHGPHAEDKFCGDRLVRRPGRELAQHLELAIG